MGETVRCQACGRATWANRPTCLYCGASQSPPPPHQPPQMTNPAARLTVIVALFVGVVLVLVLVGHKGHQNSTVSQTPTTPYVPPSVATTIAQGQNLAHEACVAFYAVVTGVQDRTESVGQATKDLGHVAGLAREAAIGSDHWAQLALDAQRVYVDAQDNGPESAGDLAALQGECNNNVP